MALSPDIIQEYFNQAPKCKIAGTIKKIEIGNKNECTTDGKIFIKGENNTTHFMYATFLENGCTFDSYHIPFFESEVKIGTNVNYILEQDKYRAFDINTTKIDTQNIPYCIGNIITPNQNYYYGGIFILIIIIIILFLKKKKISLIGKNL